MTQKSLTAYTWNCDIPGCKDTLTAYGPLYAMENGWGQYAIESFGMAGDRPNYLKKTMLNLCPDHTQELKGFLFNDNINAEL